MKRPKCCVNRCIHRAAVAIIFTGTEMEWLFCALHDARIEVTGRKRGWEPWQVRSVREVTA